MINEDSNCLKKTKRGLTHFAHRAGYGRTDEGTELKGYHEANFIKQWWNTDHIIITPLTRFITLGSIIFSKNLIKASLIPFSIEFVTSNSLSLYPLLKETPLNEVDAALCTALFNAHMFHMVSQLTWKLLISYPWYKVTGDIMDIRNDISENEHKDTADPKQIKEYQMHDLRELGQRILTQFEGSNFNLRYYVFNYVVPVLSIAPAILSESLAANYLFDVIKKQGDTLELGISDNAYYIGLAVCVSVAPMAAQYALKRVVANWWASNQYNKINKNDENNGIESGLLSTPLSDETGNYPDYFPRELRQEVVRGSSAALGFNSNSTQSDEKKVKVEPVDITLPPEDPFKKGEPPISTLSTKTPLPSAFPKKQPPPRRVQTTADECKIQGTLPAPPPLLSDSAKNFTTIHARSLLSNGEVKRDSPLTNNSATTFSHPAVRRPPPPRRTKAQKSHRPQPPERSVKPPPPPPRT